MFAGSEADRARPGAPTGAAPGPAGGRAAGDPAAPGRLAVSERHRAPPDPRLLATQRRALSSACSNPAWLPARPGPPRPPGLSAPPLGVGPALAQLYSAKASPAPPTQPRPRPLIWNPRPTPFTEATPLLTVCQLQPPRAQLPRKAALKTRKKSRETPISTLRLRRGGRKSRRRRR